MTERNSDETQEPIAAEVAPPPAAGAAPATAPSGAAAPLEAAAPPEAAAEAPAAAEAAPRPQRDGDRREPREAGERGERRRRFGRRRVCSFCVDKAETIDYKDPAKLRRYLSDRARIEPRRKTGTCAKHQRWLAVAHKRARHLALLPYTPEHIRLSGGGRR
jgi:small subunit ribosomal protein S18